MMTYWQNTKISSHWFNYWTEEAVRGCPSLVGGRSSTLRREPKPAKPVVRMGRAGSNPAPRATSPSHLFLHFAKYFAEAWVFAEFSAFDSLWMFIHSHPRFKPVRFKKYYRIGRISSLSIHSHYRDFPILPTDLCHFVSFKRSDARFDEKLARSAHILEQVQLFY